MHITYIPSNDEKRHKTWCIHYNGGCILNGHCNGSAHCEQYSDEAENLSGIKYEKWIKRVSLYASEEITHRILSKTPYKDAVAICKDVCPKLKPDEIIKNSSLLDVFIDGDRVVIPFPENLTERYYYKELSNTIFTAQEEQLWDSFKHFNFQIGWQSGVYKFIKILTKTLSQTEIVTKLFSVLTLERLCFRYYKEFSPVTKIVPFVIIDDGVYTIRVKEYSY